MCHTDTNVPVNIIVSVSEQCRARLGARDGPGPGRAPPPPDPEGGGGRAPFPPPHPLGGPFLSFFQKTGAVRAGASESLRPGPCPLYCVPFWGLPLRACVRTPQVL